MIKFLRFGFLLFAACLQVACDKAGAGPDPAVELGSFNLDFVVIHRTDDPEMALRPAGIDEVPYNVATWRVASGATGDLEQVERDVATQGDGFDDRILDQSAAARTANYFNTGKLFRVSPKLVEATETGLRARFAPHPLFDLSADVKIEGEPFPLVTFNLRAKSPGFFSVGYLGAPQFALEQVDEVWQPLIWQELRVPEQPFLTLAYRATLPTAMVREGERTFAALAHPKELPFQPLPLAGNSRFGVAVRTAGNFVKPMIFAPVMGGAESEFQQQQEFSFSFYAVETRARELTRTYELLARDIYGFRDYRSNAIASLNTTFENILDYALSGYAQWKAELKGSSYSTDVPGAVKNVSSLNALSLALATDNRRMFEERAYPLMEYMLSREKFLFSLDPEQKIQHPSRALKGPVAPVSELGALYAVLGEGNDFLMQVAEAEYSASRIRNLDYPQSGDSWQNALALYRASGQQEYLQKAVAGADRYLEKRVETPQAEYAKGSFFWPKFVPAFIDLYRLYEATGSGKYLEAAQLAARRYTMFTWMAPRIPDDNVVVNEGGKAPVYWYLKSKGHQQMYAEEESVPAWRLSEIGLTPESSGTSSGHRGIFMANYAPWLLRIGHDAGDPLLREVAKASVIGRYRNFPGYHINTARTTIYEQADYPLRDHEKLSVNSFHYNHILPMASMLLDYLISDVYARSNGEVDFPSQYIEGYAYLQNKFYGHAPGSFYGEEGVRLWMPSGLLQIDSLELNYVSGYRGDTLYLALANQSDSEVVTDIGLNPDLVDIGTEVALTRLSKVGGKSLTGAGEGVFKVTVPADGLAVLRLDGVKPRVQMENTLASSSAAGQNYRELEFGKARAMLFDLGEFGRRAYIYLQDDDSVFSEVSLSLPSSSGEVEEMVDSSYPFAFTVPLAEGRKSLEFRLSGVGVDGEPVEGPAVTLGR